MKIYLFLHKKNRISKKTVKINYRIRFLCLSLFISMFLIMFAPELTRFSGSTVNAQTMESEDDTKEIDENNIEKKDIEKKDINKKDIDKKRNNTAVSNFTAISLNLNTDGQMNDWSEEDFIKSMYATTFLIESSYQESNQTECSSYEEKHTDSDKVVNEQDNAVDTDSGQDYDTLIDTFDAIDAIDTLPDLELDMYEFRDVQHVLDLDYVKALYKDSQEEGLLKNIDYEETLTLFSKTESIQKSEGVVQSEAIKETASNKSGSVTQEASSTQQSSNKATSGKEASSDVNSTENEDEGLVLVFNPDMIMKLSETELAILERIVEAEAGGEGIYGKMLVANVVLNRVNNKDFPDTIKSVVFQNGQFSPIKDGRYDKVKISKETKEAVTKVLEGEDYSKGALYFFARSKTSNKKAAWFDNCLQKVLKYRGHEFFIEK